MRTASKPGTDPKSSQKTPSLAHLLGAATYFCTYNHALPPLALCIYL